MNTSLRAGQKSVLSGIYIRRIECPSKVELKGRPGLFVDGMALGMAQKRHVQSDGLLNIPCITR